MKITLNIRALIAVIALCLICTARLADCDDDNPDFLNRNISLSVENSSVDDVIKQ